MRAPKSLILLFLFLTFQVSLLAHAPKVVLLTSLEPSENRPPLRSKNWNINEKLEERFEKYLERYEIDLEPVVVHFADQVTLYKTLQSNDVKALIWVSHAGYQTKGRLSKASSIIDFKGRDLKGVFQALGSSIKFLGLVGCQGQGFIEQWKSEGWPYSKHSLTTFSREKKTDARKGLRLAMKALANAIEGNEALFRHVKELDENSNEQNTFPIKVVRENVESQKMSSIQIYQRGRLLTVLPASMETQEFVLKIKKPTQNKKVGYKIVVDSGESSLSQSTNLGRLHFEAPYQNHWKLFSTPDGKPFGVGTNIYVNKILIEKLTPNI